MNKKSFVLATLVATSSLTSAKAAHGPYVGLGVAGLIAHHDANLRYREGGFAPETNTFGFSKYAPGANILLGYGGMINNFFWGAEVEYMFGNLKKTNASQRDADTLRITKAESTGGAWGAALRVGYRVDRVTPYLRFGVETRRFKGVHSSSDAGHPLFDEISRNVRRTGFVPGVGIEFDLQKDPNKKGKFVVGLEYRTALYRSIKFSGYGPGLGRTVNYKLTPRISTGLITFKYSWF